MKYTTISANTLFHFTDSLAKIKGVLRKGFYPRYYLEDHSVFFPEEGPDPNSQYAIPMVCFCDIPLSQIRNHIDFYGGYAIGLSKKWGEKQRINPVLYGLPHSLALRAVTKSYHIQRYDTNNKQVKELQHLLEYFMAYIKPYTGKVWRKGEYATREVRFYDEREWRFVPENSTLLERHIPNKLSKVDFLNLKIRQKYNQALEKTCCLNFEPGDIKYIIVKKSTEILAIVDEITTFSGKYAVQDTKLLMTKIISLEQILEDF